MVLPPLLVTPSQSILKLLLISYLCMWEEIVVEGFNGKRLRVAAEQWDPWVVLDSEEAGQTKYSGIMIKILEYLQESLNFTTTIVRPPDLAWGAIDSNGRWNGMVGMVKRNEVDFALGKSMLEN